MLTCLPTMSTAFAAAKAALVTGVLLVHPFPGAVLSLATAASENHIGLVLQQQVCQHWLPLGFYSKKLSKTEVNYSMFDRELLAIVSGIKHFCSRLEGIPFMRCVPPTNRFFSPSLGFRRLAFISEYTRVMPRLAIKTYPPPWQI